MASRQPWALTIAAWSVAMAGCSEAPPDAVADGGPTFAPCGLDLAPAWRVAGLDVTINDASDGLLLSYGVDLDGSDERFCSFPDGVDPDGREGVDDLLGALPQITGTANPLLVSGDFDPILHEVEREGRCAAEVELGAIVMPAMGTATNWRAGPLGAVFLDFELQGTTAQIPLRDSWLVMREGELHLTGGLSHEALALFFQEVYPDNDLTRRIIGGLADLDGDGDGICERSSIVLDAVPR